MSKAAQGHELEGFSEIVKRDEPLAPYTYLKVGGPAEMLVQPRTREELAGVIQQCFLKGIPIRVLGGGCNILVRDEGVRGVVIRLSEPVFTQLGVNGRQVRAGSGAAPPAPLSAGGPHGLAGPQALRGPPAAARRA